MNLYRSLNNESGVAALIMVVAALIIVGLIGMDFIIEQQNKHQATAVTVNAEQAQAVAEAGYRYAEQCLLTNDAGCPCAPGCFTWSGLANFPSQAFGATSNSSFEVSFSNGANCSVEISSLGTVNNTRRLFNNVLTRNSIGGAGVVSVANAQSLVGPTIPAITVNNTQSAFSASNGSNTLTEPNYVVPGGSSLVLVVTAGAVGGNNDRIPTSVTFGGTPMNLADQREWGGNQSRPGVAQYYLEVTAGQVGDIVATWAGNNDNRTLVAATLGNATAVPEVTETSQSNANSYTDNITTLSTNAMIITSAYTNGDNDVTPLGAGHTELTGNNSPTTSEAESGMGFLQAGAPGMIMGTGYDWTGAGNTRWASVFAAYPHANRTISMNYTVPAGSNQILVVVAGAEDDNAPAVVGSTVPVSATFNGNPMTLVNTQSVTTVSEAGVGMFWLGVNAGDTGTITVTYGDSTIDDKTLHAYTLNDASGPQESISVNTSTTATDITANFAVNLSAGAMIVSGGYQGNGNGITAALPLASTHVINTDETAASSTGVMGSRPVPIPETPSGIGFQANFNHMALILASFPPPGGGPCL